jgi:hypothetical protein
LDHGAAYRDLCLAGFLVLHFRCLEALPVLQDLAKFRGPPVDQDGNREVMLRFCARSPLLAFNGGFVIWPSARWVGV